jgi:hypothetical protein
MATKKYGNGDYQFGFNDPNAAAIAEAIGLKPQTMSITSTPEYETSGMDENGVTDVYIVGPDKYTMTLNGYVVDAAAFSAQGATFEFDDKFWIVTNKKRDLSNAELQKAEMTAVSFEQITAEA